MENIKLKRALLEKIRKENNRPGKYTIPKMDTEKEIEEAGENVKNKLDLKRELQSGTTQPYELSEGYESEKTKSEERKKKLQEILDKTPEEEEE